MIELLSVKHNYVIFFYFVMKPPTVRMSYQIVLIMASLPVWPPMIRGQGKTVLRHVNTVVSVCLMHRNWFTWYWYMYNVSYVDSCRRRYHHRSPCHLYCCRTKDRLSIQRDNLQTRRCVARWLPIQLHVRCWESIPVFYHVSVSNWF